MRVQESASATVCAKSAAIGERGFRTVPCFPVLSDTPSFCCSLTIPLVVFSSFQTLNRVNGLAAFHARIEFHPFHGRS